MAGEVSVKIPAELNKKLALISMLKDVNKTELLITIIEKGTKPYDEKLAKLKKLGLK